MIKKNTIFIIYVLIMLVLSACSLNNQKFERQEFKMDTTMTLTAYGSNANIAIAAAYKRVDEIEKIASPTIQDSDVNKINQAAGKEYIKVHPEIIKMIKAAVKYSEISNGAFDITVGPLIHLWGIGTNEQRIPHASEIKEKLSFTGYKNISINETDSSVKLNKEGMSIDLGGIAKGYAADEVIRIFRNYGVKSAIINLGGSSVFTLGQKPKGTVWSIGIQHPREKLNKVYACIVKMPQTALSTSGDYQRFFIDSGKRYHHILDPFTGYPADTGIISNTIVVDSEIPDCNMLADILTKVTFVSGIDKGFSIIDSIPGVACLVVTSDFKVHRSSGWNLDIEELSTDFTLVN